MLVPRFVHGLTRDVKKESLRRIRLFQKGATWAEAMADDLVDVSTLPGLIVLRGPSVLMGFEPHAHIYCPFYWAWLTLLKQADHTTETGRDQYWRAMSDIFFDAVKTSWGVLGVLGDTTGTWMRASSHQWPYIWAVERDWDELSALGERFTGGSQTRRPLWELASAAYYAVCALGLSAEEVLQVSPQGFHALYRRLLEVRAAQGLPPPPGEDTLSAPTALVPVP